LILSNINKLNLRLVRAFIYLSQFRLNVKYRFDKLHVIPNALSRLLAAKFSAEVDLDDLETLNLKMYYSEITDLESN